MSPERLGPRNANAYSLSNVPPEILERIALHCATDSFLGPPAALVPLLLIDRRIYSCLSSSSNPLLYSQIFVSKFDIVAPQRRMSASATSAPALCAELRRRCLVLSQIRSRKDALIGTVGSRTAHTDLPIEELLWYIYLMIIDNDGKNNLQLFEYSRLAEWIDEYWFHPHGRSLAIQSLSRESWTPQNEQNGLAMWIFYFSQNQHVDHSTLAPLPDRTKVMRLVALGAHKYGLCDPQWTDFSRASGAGRPMSTSSPIPRTIAYFGENVSLCCTRMTVPAISTYMCMENLTFGDEEHMTDQRRPSTDSRDEMSFSSDLDTEWARCRALSNRQAQSNNFFVPGSIAGAWEGRFAYAEFTVYAALLAGAGPKVLDRELVAQHRQTWRLQEYCLFDDAIDEQSKGNMLPVGDPLRAHLPTSARFSETTSGLEIDMPGHDLITYSKIPEASDRIQPRRIKDVLVIGQGHSAWGEFDILGRARPYDGLLSLSKEYVDTDRGRWLYRGYVIGPANSRLSGRWRDTMTPPHASGYEGCFFMSRRQ